MIKTKSTLHWVKSKDFSRPTILNGDTIAVACGNLISFTNLETGKEIYYNGVELENVNGISNVAGHHHFPIFAYTESSINTRIFVVSFPEFRRIHILNEEHQGLYIDIRFSDTEYLIALSSIPNYQLEVWNWRLGKLLVIQETELLSHVQHINCNNGSPLIISQYAPKLGILNIWETHVSLDEGFILKRSTVLSFANKGSRNSLTFGFDNNIYMVDKIGNFYSLVPTNGIPKKLWDWTDSVSSEVAHICNYKSGYVIAGSNGNLKFIEKVDGSWTEIWSITLEDPINVMTAVNDKLYCIDRTQKILRLDDIENNHTFIEIGVHDIVKYFDLIYPVCEYVLVITKFDDIGIIKVLSGDLISTIKFSDILTIRTNPSLPFAAIGDEKGILHILSCYNPEEPKFLTEFHLSSTGIKSIKFSQTGEFLVTNDRNGDYFVIKSRLGTKMNILLHFHHEDFILEYCLLESNNELIILILTNTKNKKNEILTSSSEIKKITISQKDYTYTKDTLHLPQPYISIGAIFGYPNRILATAYMESNPHIFEMQENSFKLIDKLKTIHQVKYVRLYSDENHIITWSMEGIICIFNLNTYQLETAHLAHSRRFHGIKNVRCDLYRQHCISLGYTGHLKCFRIKPNNKTPEKVRAAQNRINNILVERMFTKKTEGFKPEGENIGKIWSEFQQKEKLEMEEKQSAPKKKAILKELDLIKLKVKELIDENEQLPDEERLSIQNFNLSNDWSESVCEAARKERNHEDQTLKKFVTDQNSITEWIIKNTWNNMEVQGCKIRGIFSEIFCENYGLLYSDKINQDQLTKIKIWRKNEILVSRNDRFQPWKPQIVHQSELYVPKISYYEEEVEMNSTSSSETGNETTRKHGSKYSLSGTSSHGFIDPFPYRYQQIEVVAYQRAFLEKTMGEHDIYNLKIYFNNEFNYIKSIKEDFVDQVKKRNDRLRYIQKELGILAELKGISKSLHNSIIDPDYSPDERPETIINVEDWEVGITPYLSPSQEKELELKARAEEERRLALMADDFRERALIKMMDGVLEKRWEDEIKKIPPKPDCILNNKDPKEYKKEDFHAIEEYEKQRKFLEIERERYRVQLEDQQIILEHAQDEQILKFNYRCSKLFMSKLRVDAAVKQEELKLLRNGLYNYQKIQLKQKERDLADEMSDRRKMNEELHNTLEELEKRVQDSRIRYDQLQTKDKLLDKQFKLQFSEFASQLVVDQAYKIFKKRPKFPQRAWATSAISSDLANRISTKDSSRSGPPLPEECYEFLNLIDTIENYTNAPNLMDSHLWDLLCRMRRIKIESEFKVKACGAQLAEAEATYNAFVKELNAKKAILNNLEKEVDDLQESYSELIINSTIQIVIPRGIVEIPLSGRISDFEGSVLLNLSDVKDINTIIKKAGQTKLRTMANAAIFRRKIIYNEWQHKVLRMTVEDLKTNLNLIEKYKVTKEIQAYLKRKAMKKPDDLTQTALNREIDTTQKFLQKSLEPINKEIEDMNKKIALRKRENRFLDRRIQNINIDVTEQNLMRDDTLEENELRLEKERMAMIVERGRLVRKVQWQHAQILELTTMLELERLRTFPTLTVPSKNVFS